MSRRLIIEIVIVLSCLVTSQALAEDRVSLNTANGVVNCAVVNGEYVDCKLGTYDVAREQAAREQAAREQAAREQAAREQAAREQAARELAAQTPERVILNTANGAVTCELVNGEYQNCKQVETRPETVSVNTENGLMNCELVNGVYQNCKLAPNTTQSASAQNNAQSSYVIQKSVQNNNANTDNASKTPIFVQNDDSEKKAYLRLSENENYVLKCDYSDGEYKYCRYDTTTSVSDDMPVADSFLQTANFYFTLGFGWDGLMSLVGDFYACGGIANLEFGMDRARVVGMFTSLKLGGFTDFDYGNTFFLLKWLFGAKVFGTWNNTRLFAKAGFGVWHESIDNFSVDYFLSRISLGIEGFVSDHFVLGFEPGVDLGTSIEKSGEGVINFFAEFYLSYHW